MAANGSYQTAYPVTPGDAAPLRQPSRHQRADALLARLVDAGLVGVILIVPFALGGRHAVGAAVLVGLAAWLGICWCAKQALSPRAAWNHSAAELILFAALVLIGLQVIALPAAVIGWLSPRFDEVLPLWASAGDGTTAWAAWNTLSFDPATTRCQFFLLGAFAVIFLVTVQRIRRVEDVEFLLRWIAIATVTMAVFGLLQLFAGNGKFFWLYQHPFSDTNQFARGSFSNPNHFAQFIAAGLGSVTWLALRAIHRKGPERTGGRHLASQAKGQGLSATGLLCLVLLAVCVFAGLMSLSRAGILAMLVAGFVTLLVLYRGSLVTGKTLLALTSVGLLVGASVCIYGREMLSAELDDFASLEELDSHHVRRELLAANARVMADFPLFGTGAGTHREVYPLYLESLRASRFEYTHAENSYIQVGSEAGIPGLGLALAALGLCTTWCLLLLRHCDSRRTLLCVAAISSAVAANAVHAAVDFIWYVPGCMVIVVVLAACACRLWQIHRQEAGRPAVVHPVPRVLWLAGGACLLLAACGIAPSVVAGVAAQSSWERFLAGCKTLEKKNAADEEETLRGFVADLSRVVRWQPRHSRAHVELATAHLKLFERKQQSADPPFGVSQIRDAALASKFPSSDALDGWLCRVLGDNRRHLYEALEHARLSVRSCPLQGKAYLILGKLTFLEGPRSPGKAAYVAQALKVRPFDGTVLFEAGVESLLAGKTDEALSQWRASFQSGPVHQSRLLESFSRTLPVLVFLDEFQPDLEALRLMVAHYRQHGPADELSLVLPRYVRVVEEQAQAARGKRAGRLWREAAGAYGLLDAKADRARCLRRALDNNAFDHQSRLQLGMCLCDLGDYRAAEKELARYLRQKPHDENVRALLDRVVDKRLRLASR